MSQTKLQQKFEGREVKVVTSEPKVELLAYTGHPFDIAMATARTCYAPELIYAKDITPGQRERIGASIYEAGHHTPFQHPTFVFGLQHISRHVVWSFFHSHPFYNSEQQSQRYVVMNDAAVFVPPIEGEARELYERAVEKSWTAYNKISELLVGDNFSLMEKIGKLKGQNDKQIMTDSEKKAIENARYVLPLGAFTTMYHTISGIVLKRYVRMARMSDCPYEAKMIVDMMVEEVRKIDPDFIERVGDEAFTTEELMEERLYAELLKRQLSQEKMYEMNAAAAAAFDADLGDKWSKLILSDTNTEKVVADSVREVFGATPDALSDDEAIDYAVNPAKNLYLNDSLNSWDMSPVMRALNHAQYTFKKRMTHTGDSQEQRHRTVPGSRPLLRFSHTREPDYLTPPVFEKNLEARAIYDGIMAELWETKNRLIEMGVPAEFACYILPNAVTLRFTQSGSLLHFMHKWRLRSCFLAQLEIYNCAVDELMQVREVHPRLGKYLGPPCFTRFHGGVGHPKPERVKEIMTSDATDKSLQLATTEGPCPEGPRWCGINVWMNFPKTKRPF
jgi:thymidylate synthase ThyX